MSGGISAQYGFLYQRKVFLLKLLENMGSGKVLVFEGVDDIDIEQEDSIFGITEAKRFIQVKSGTVGKKSFAKIIGNWLINEDFYKEYSYKYTIIAEHDFSFDIYNIDFQNEIRDIYVSQKDAKSSSICKKVYDKYIDIIYKDDFLNMLFDIISSVDIDVLTMQELEKQIPDIYNNIYCTDIVNFEIAKQKRYEHFEQYIFHDIDEDIKAKRKCVIDYIKFYNHTVKCRDEVSDSEYKVNYKVFKKTKKKIEKRKLPQYFYNFFQFFSKGLSISENCIFYYLLNIPLFLLVL